MAPASKPTNEQIMTLLEQVLDELGNLKNGQQQITVDLAEIVRTIKA